MELKFFCPRWGSEGLDWDLFLQKVRSAGYDGVEIGFANGVSDRSLEEVWNLAEKYHLLIIAQHYATYDADYNRHYEQYEGWLKKMQPYKPEKINSQTGKDFFSFEQNRSLIDLAAEYSERSGVFICHETHRNKFSFAAHITADYLEKIPYLRITLDASHWVNVAESYLEDQPEAMRLAISRTDHIHARVGHTEGPQVTDPRAQEWRHALDIHLGWWDRVIEHKKKEGAAALTITPEFGPPPYLVQMPFSRQPLSDQWEINEYMLTLLKTKYT